MSRENIEKIQAFVSKYEEEFSSIRHNLEDQLNSTTDQVIMEAEDDLVNLQITINEMIEESQDILSLIDEILP